MRKKIQPTYAVLMTLLALILLAQWAGLSSTGTPNIAMAQIPDSGAQRTQIIEQLKSINSNLEKLTTLLADGKLQVRTAGSDVRKE